MDEENEKPTLENASGKVDPYLRMSDDGKDNRKFPFLLQIDDSLKSEFEKLAEELKKNGSLQISSNIGNIYACRATREGILALDKCDAVECMGGSRPWDGRTR